MSNTSVPEPVRHVWASADPPERLTLWRGNGGVDWEREYVPAEQLRGAVSAIREVAVALRKVAEWEPESVDTELQALADRLDAIGGQ